MYQVIFCDNTEYVGGEPNNSLWNEMPQKPIKSILYWLNEDSKYLFTDFEEYCHVVERSQVFNGSQKPQETVTKALIMGRVGKRVYQVIYNLKTGKTYQSCLPYGQEYSNQELLSREGEFIGWKNGKPVGGWHQGIIGDFPGPKLKRII